MCLQALEMFELDLLEHISAWKLCKLTVRKLICAGGVKTSAAAESVRFMSSPQSDSSVYSRVSLMKCFCFYLPGINSKNAAQCG